MANISFMPQVSAMDRTPATETQAFPKIPNPPQPVPDLGNETVKLSVGAQVKLMYHQGLSPTTIAAQMGMSASQLSGYLPGSTPIAPAVPVAPQPEQTPAAGARPGGASSAAAAVMPKG